MIGFRASKFKRSFFDSAAVTRGMDRATEQALKKIGAFVRRRARSSIRKRKRVSRPGQPPSSHTGALRKAIEFRVEPRKRSVVVGPVFRSGKVGQAPPALERGGRSRVLIGSRKKGNRKTRPVKVKPRPFMRPALEKERDNFPRLWRDSVVP